MALFDQVLAQVEAKREMDCRPVVLISVSSDILSGALDPLMRSSRKSAQIVHIGDAAGLPQTVRDLCPRVVILDTMLYCPGISTTIDAIRQSCGHTQCIVLVDDPQHLAEAKSSSADLVIQEGFPAQKLAAELSALWQKVDHS